MNELQRLKSNPSEDSWELELFRVLHGERELSVGPLGNAAEYAEDMIVNSTDSPLSRISFLRALENLCKTWNPSADDSALFLSHLLDLLSRYTPPAGVGKLIKLLEFETTLDTPIPGMRGIDLRRNALHALDHYYPTPPVPPDPPYADLDRGTLHAAHEAFDCYVALVEKHLHHPKHAAYAARTLMKLRVLKPTPPRICEILHANPIALEGVLSYLLDHAHESATAHALATVYETCLQEGSAMEERFRAALISFGAQFEYATLGPLVHTATSGKALELRLIIVDESLSRQYYELYYETYSRATNYEERLEALSLAT